MSQFLLKSTVLNDSRIADAAKRCNTHRDMIFGQVIRLWIACQDRKRGVLNTREMAIAMDADDKLVVIRSLFASGLLTSPADMRPMIRAEWLDVWAAHAEVDDKKTIIAELNYGSEADIEMRTDHYLYVNGSYDSLQWVKKKADAGRIGGKASAEARKAKSTTVQRPSTTVQRPSTIVQQTPTTVNDRSTTVQIDKNKNANDFSNDRSTTVNDRSATVNDRSTTVNDRSASVNDRSTISTKLERFQAISIAISTASDEAGERADADAPEGARPPTPLDRGAASEETGPERGSAEWVQQVSHRAFGSYRVKGLRYPTNVKPSCGDDEIGKWADVTVATHAWMLAIAQAAKVDITDFQELTVYTLGRIAKLLAIADERHTIACRRVLSAFIGSALIHRETGRSYFQPTVENFLKTQEKFKKLARDSRDVTGWKLTVAEFRQACIEMTQEQIDGMKDGKCLDLEVFCHQMFQGPIPIPVLAGDGKNTTIQLPALVEWSVEDQIELGLRAAEPALESTQEDQPDPSYQNDPESILEPIAASSGDISQLEANTGRYHWEDPNYTCEWH